MFARRFTVAVAVLLTITLLAFSAMRVPAQFAPSAQASPAHALGTVHELAKVTLPETSVNSPGFFSYVNQPYTGSVLAWAGTDLAHHINVMTSVDGLHYGHKLTLSDTTVNRPSVVQMSQAAGAAVILAWRGTDGNHSLNVLFDVYGRPQRLTLADNSFTSPALAIFHGDVLLGWTGTDGNHSLNVRTIGLAPLRAGPKTVLTQFNSDAWPNLTNRGSHVVLSWATRASRVNLADSADGKSFTSVLGAGLPQTSTFGVDYLNFMTEGGPPEWIAWSGLDAGHHLNVEWTTRYPQWPNPASTVTTLPESALGGPELGFGSGLLIAWTGTDAAHHLNVARLEGF